jgi:hypothetical protein
VMKEVSKRNGKLRRATKKKESTEADLAEAARDASTIAVLALAVHDDTHEVKKPAEIKDWQKFSKEFQVQMTATAAAFKKKDMTAAGDVWKKANSLCNDCHKQFKPEE